MTQGEKGGSAAKGMTPRAKDFSQWYQDVVSEAQLAEHAPVKGCMVIRPYGYAIWERIQGLLDARIKEAGARNAYFPMFIPESFMKKEAQHVEGFSPECAVVTHGGGEKLEEPLMVRPTSETIINYMFEKWIQSWRDLPLLINQWCNVVRWEMRPRLFLRTTEFLWQEGHTAHATREEAVAYTQKILSIYKELAEGSLAIPVLTGPKSDSERFAGAVTTYAIEAMMQDGKALQAGTSHFLGQTFSKAFGTRFQAPDGKLEHPWQTSWGVSTRLVGAVVMTHGDDRGLVLPPAIAPYEAVVVPIWRDEADRARVCEQAEALARSLAPRRVHLDARAEHKPGWKFFHWEVRGVPVRIEIGPQDLAKGQAVLVRRDSGQKDPVPLDGLGARLATLLDEMQKGLLGRARNERDRRTVKVRTLGELSSFLEGEGGFAWAPWCGQPVCEEKVKGETKATNRVLGDASEGACLVCGQASRHQALFARNY